MDESVPESELHLEDAAIRALAEHLVYDAEVVDDVVQETWMASLSSPPSANHPGRWMRRVISRTAGRIRRRDERRRDSELMVVRRGGWRTTEFTDERDRARRTVVEAVLNLAEPYRGTVLLRYFEGLAPREIAERSGTPVETVRTRLKRAHGDLRGQLADRESCSLQLLLVPAFLAREVSQISGAIMSTKSKIAVMGSVLMLAVACFFFFDFTVDDEAALSGSSKPSLNRDESSPARATTAVAPQPASTESGVSTAERDPGEGGKVTPEFEVLVATKIRTPMEYAVAPVRQLGGETDGYTLWSHANNMAMPLFRNPVPTGYAEVGTHWVHSNGLLERWKYAERLFHWWWGSLVYPYELVEANGVRTAEGIVDYLVERLLRGRVSPEARASYVDCLTRGAPFDFYHWETTWRVRELASMMVGSPEYQKQ